MRIFSEQQKNLGPAAHIDFESVTIPAASRQDLVNWLNTHLPVLPKSNLQRVPAGGDQDNILAK